ncbi:MAG: hypothetical protein A2Z02_00360 [Chloroflexi bacterium RBG_16_48_7]|nr:MAG: hypothetical protein A2Z02_00360 [Chloroflexi bacterium RBG_16_48_7]
MKPFLLVDAGANVDCRPNYLVQFAQLGNIFATKVLNMKEPRVALLNVGAEEVKGNSLAKDSYKLLKQSGTNFIGNMEGHEVLKGKADIIVTDGFTGNVLLKTLEGFGEFFHGLLKPGPARDIDGLQGTALVRYADLIAAAKQMDYAEYGGACLLGVNGNVIVAHGRSQARAIKNAIYLAYQTAKSNTVKAIKDSISTLKTP